MPCFTAPQSMACFTAPYTIPRFTALSVNCAMVCRFVNQAMVCRSVAIDGLRCGAAGDRTMPPSAMPSRGRVPLLMGWVDGRHHPPINHGMDDKPWHGSRRRAGAGGRTVPWLIAPAAGPVGRAAAPAAGDGMNGVHASDRSAVCADSSAVKRRLFTIIRPSHGFSFRTCARTAAR